MSETDTDPGSTRALLRMLAAQDGDALPGLPEEAALPLRAILSRIPEGIAIAEAPSAAIRWASDVALDMLGPDLVRAGGDAVATPLPLFRAGNGGPVRFEDQPLTRAVRDGEAVTDEEWLLRHADGRLLPVLCNAGPIRDRQGAITGGIIAWRDISALRAAEAGVRAGAQRLRSLVGATSSIIWTTDALGRFVEPQQSWERYTGQGWEAHRGFGWVEALHPDDRAAVLETWTRACAEGAVYRTEGRVRHAESNTYRPFVARGAPVRAADGTVLEWIGTYTDVSARREAERNLEVTLREKDLLLQEMNHRVFNSFQRIATIVSLQSARSGDAAVKEHLGKIYHRIQTMGLVHRRLYSGRSVDRIDLGGYLTELCADIQQVMADKDDQWRIEADCDSLPVAIDSAVPLGLVVNELVTNACRHAFDRRSPGLVRVAFRQTPDGFLLSVTDDGCGLPDPMPAPPGALGMLLIRSLVGQLEGSLSVERTGPGTCFRIALPRTSLIR
ncbi:sensor histidine kinase [Rhodocista pekingensis]|uniref:histidine kinase n=1 Tax=Rhodocista pekingensis TaxID=201185 RepID=A0ABW2KW05_9PROT